MVWDMEDLLFLHEIWPFFHTNGRFVDFVADVVVVVIVNVFVVALIVVTGHIIFSYVYKMLI